MEQRKKITVSVNNTIKGLKKDSNSKIDEYNNNNIFSKIV